MEEPERLVVKIIVLGCANVGKTSLMKRYCQNTFTQTRRATIGVDFATKRVEVNGQSVLLQIWDTAGQERFHGGTLGGPFYRGADGALIVYDLSDAQTFDQVDQWRRELLSKLTRENDEGAIPTVVVGNKTDKVRARGPAGPNIGDPPAAAPEYPFGEIPASGVSAHPATTEGRTQAGEIAALEARRRERVLNYCQERGLGHVQTSCLDGSGVEQAVGAIIIQAVAKRVEKNRQQRSAATGRRSVSLEAGDSRSRYLENKKTEGSCGGCFGVGGE